MTDRIEVFAVTVPALTPAKTHITDISLARPGNVIGVDIVIPDGVNAAAGIALLTAHQQVIPYKAGTYLTGNNETLKWQLSNYLATGSWQADVYNNGMYPHTFYIRFAVNEPASPSTVAVASVPTTFLNPASLGG